MCKVIHQITDAAKQMEFLANAEEDDDIIPDISPFNRGYCYIDKFWFCVEFQNGK